MRLYLYLRNVQEAATWINGGKVPLSLSSAYRRDERSGIYTPDENKQISLEGENVKPWTKATIDSAVANTGTGTIIFKGNVINKDGQISTNVSYSDSYEEALIVCFSTSFNVNIASKLGKAACVEITDINLLKAALDLQLGVTGIADICKYTETANRNHFLKSLADSWQCEYRIVWKGFKEPQQVEIPEKCAVDRTDELAMTSQ